MSFIRDMTIDLIVVIYQCNSAEQRLNNFTGRQPLGSKNELNRFKRIVKMFSYVTPRKEQCDLDILDQETHLFLMELRLLKARVAL